jgi:hypothetical protein
MGFKKTNEGRVFFQRSNRRVETLDRGADENIFNIHDPDADKTLFEDDDRDVRRSPLTGREIRVTSKPFEIRDPAIENAQKPAPDREPALNESQKEQAVPEIPQQNDTLIPQTEILDLLRSLNQRLKTTKAERERVQKQMDVYRALIEGLETKSENAEKAYEALKTEMSGREQKAHERAEKAEQIALNTRKELDKTKALLKDLETKNNKTTATISALGDEIGQTKESYSAALKVQEQTLKKEVQAVKAQTQHTKDSVQKDTTALFETLKKELAETNDRQDTLSKQVGDTLAQQAGLIRKIDKVADDRARFMRKIELIEDTVLQTRDALSALREYNVQTKTLVRDQTQTPQHEALPKALLAQSAARYAADKADKKVHKESLTNRIVTHPVWPLLLAFVLGAVLIFWLLSNPRLGQLKHWFTPDTRPVSETPLARIKSPPAQDLRTPHIPVFQETVTPSAFLTDGVDVSDPANAALLNDIMESNPDALGTAMNALEPATGDAKADRQDVTIDLPVVSRATPDPILQKDTVDQALSNPLPLTDPVKTNLPDVIRRVEAAALRGEAQAQHDLGAIYVSGYEGVTKDFERAAYWFEKAANQGVANAAYNLGVLHHQGLGMPADIKEALNWYEKAADLNHPEAQYNLGIAYIEGVGVHYDAQKAATYFHAAADRGIMEAAYNLGLIYENGLLGQTRPDDALMWYKAAADQGSAEARTAIEELGQRLNMTADEIQAYFKTSTISASAAPEKTPQTSIVRTPRDIPLSPGENKQILLTQIQEYLIHHNLYPGPADGRFGPLTRDAIRSYQARYNLPITGTADQALLHHMLSNDS